MTLFVEDVPPPLHVYVTPVEGLAVNIELVTLHVKLLLLVAPAVGALTTVIVLLAVAVQPATVVKVTE